MLRKEQILFILWDIFACYVTNDFGVSVSHNFEGHVQETHGHKPSSEHREESEVEERKAEKKGISFICSDGNLIKCTSCFYLLCQWRLWCFSLQQLWWARTWDSWPQTDSTEHTPWLRPPFCHKPSFYGFVFGWAATTISRCVLTHPVLTVTTSTCTNWMFMF